MVWPCDEKRRDEHCKAGDNNEGGREETSRKAQTEVGGQSAERSQTTPARPKADPESRRMEKGNHGDRPRTGIRSAKVRKDTHSSLQIINKDGVLEKYTPGTIYIE